MPQTAQTKPDPTPVPHPADQALAEAARVLADPGPSAARIRHGTRRDCCCTGTVRHARDPYDAAAADRQ